MSARAEAVPEPAAASAPPAHGQKRFGKVLGTLLAPQVRALPPRFASAHDAVVGFLGWAQSEAAGAPILAANRKAERRIERERQEEKALRERKRVRQLLKAKDHVKYARRAFLPGCERVMWLRHAGRNSMTSRRDC
jgi:hypothetical protein